MTVAGAVPVPGGTCPNGHSILVETDPLHGVAYEICTRGEYVALLRGRRPGPDPRPTGRGPKTSRLWTEAQRRRVVERLRKGQSIPAIARAVQRSQEAVRHIAVEAGGIKAYRRAQGRAQ